VRRCVLRAGVAAESAAGALAVRAASAALLQQAPPRAPIAAAAHGLRAGDRSSALDVLMQAHDGAIAAMPTAIATHPRRHPPIAAFMAIRSLGNPTPA